MTDPAAAAAGRCRVLVLVSGSGTLLQALIDEAVRPGAGYQVVGVLSDREDAYGLQRAREHGLPTVVVSPADFADRPAWDAAVAAACRVLRPDLVVLAGFMRILGEAFLAEYGGRTINTHPALLPSFPGAHAVRDALAHGVKVTGSSVIVVDAGVDTGPIVAQRAVPVEPDDDETSLHERIKVVERDLLVEVVSRIAAGGLRVDERKVSLR